MRGTCQQLQGLVVLLTPPLSTRVPCVMCDTARHALGHCARVQLFKGGIRYLSGGAASGFHHHEDAPHKATLAQIKVSLAAATQQRRSRQASHCLACSECSAIQEKDRPGLIISCGKSGWCAFSLSRLGSPQECSLQLTKRQFHAVQMCLSTCSSCTGHLQHRGTSEDGLADCAGKCHHSEQASPVTGQHC